ncbi:unnamed protein product [Cylicocyclus nassatus]|uniref:Uncharacterized protein n=1 Tax=Cylicocyclus nassatus TaxID=53992 RepID=A0AA36HC89_CYLNA|nr:unnamed protein product [Cylicocyclus nassatus]
MLLEKAPAHPFETYSRVRDCQSECGHFNYFLCSLAFFCSRRHLSFEGSKMTTTNLQQRQPTLFHKFSAEVRPSEMVRRDDLRLMTCPFENIAESEEEDIQLPERTTPDGRSPFAVAFESPFAKRRGTSSRNVSPTCAREFAIPRLCRGFSDPSFHCRQASTMFGSLSPEQHNGSHFLTLPSIPEAASS